MIFPALRSRSSQPEYLDTMDLDGNTVREYFRFMESTNRFAGGHAILLEGLKTACAGWPKGKTLEILDAGCGAGDVCRAVLAWAGKEGLDIHYTGIDREPAVIARCRETVPAPNTRFLAGELRGPLPRADVTVCAMVLHHLPSPEIPAVLKALYRSARRCLVISELERSLRAYLLCWLATRFTGDRRSRHDALLSVRKGFTAKELRGLMRSAGCAGTVRANGAGRLIAAAFR